MITRSVSLVIIFILLVTITGCVSTGAAKKSEETAAEVSSVSALFSIRDTLDRIGGIAKCLVVAPSCWFKGAPQNLAKQVAPYKSVEVFFGTDRQLIPNAKSPRDTFNENRGYALSYGIAEVSIPHSHHIGEFESPLVSKYFEKPEKHIVLLRINLRQQSEFMNDLRAAIAERETNAALIFVPGFSTTFEDAARRTAQIADDVQFNGVPLFYSWPSSGNISDYVSDGNKADHAVSYLKLFLKDIVMNASFTSVTLLAHSMGSRTLTQAFIALKNEMPADKLRVFKEIILAAPDIDADVFKDQIAPALIASKAAVTLYASSKDSALLLSKELNGAPRAGDSGAGLIVMNGMETLDATNIDTSLFWSLSHGYIANERTILNDLHYLIMDGMPAFRRHGLEPIPSRVDPKYWKFKR
jgi:esterase/lipase superfamily enzyme